MIFASLLVVLPPPSQIWTLTLAGDLMFDGISPNSKVLASSATIFLKSDVALANLESPLAPRNPVTPRKLEVDLRARRQYILTGSPSFASIIHAAGIDGVSLGNNHCMDHRSVGLTTMLSALGRAGVGYAGAGVNSNAARQCAVKVLPSGERIGFISALAFVTAKALWTCTPATPTSAGVNALNYGGKPNLAAIKAWVAQAKQRCDFLIVALHYGVERRPMPIPYQVALSRAFIDAGADVVWGCHPHVLEGSEIYHHHFIVYSMGNLVSGTPATSALIQLRFTGSTISAIRFEPILIRHGVTTVLVGSPARAAANAYQRLCNATAIHYRGNPAPIATSWTSIIP